MLEARQVCQAFYAAIIRSLLRTKSLLKTVLNLWISPSIIEGNHVAVIPAEKHSGDFLESVGVLFKKELENERLWVLSRGLRSQITASLIDNPLCMLPSYSHQLPTGCERGRYLALDVGGSTFRVALIELLGKENKGQEFRILKRKTVKISHAIKQLKGTLFFDWMAERIADTLSGKQVNTAGHDISEMPLSMGLAWSFPIE